MNEADFRKALEDHALWFAGCGGSRLDLQGEELLGFDFFSVNLARARLLRCDFRGSRFDGADFREADISGSRFQTCSMLRVNMCRVIARGARFNDATLLGSEASEADFRGASFSRAGISACGFSGADFSGACFAYAKMRQSDCSGCCFEGAFFNGADIREVNWGGVRGLLDPSDFMRNNFKVQPGEDGGYIAYKVFDLYHTPPEHWCRNPGAVLSEVPDYTRVTACGSGVNVGTWDWVVYHTDRPYLWRCLIRWEDLPSVVVPIGTDGKIRCGRVTLLGMVQVVHGEPE